MCRKCYPITSDFKSRHLAPQGFKRPAWRIIDRISEDLYVLSHTQDSLASYAFLFIHSFALHSHREILKAKQFNQKYRRYEEINNVPDRLRWCRYDRGWRQAEVADKLGVSCSVYKAIEDGSAQHIPKAIAQQLAKIYDVPAIDFLDAYNQFLMDGQAKRIRAYRERMGLAKKPFAKAMGIPIRCLQEWESGRKTISRKSWEKYFKNCRLTPHA